MIFRDFYKKTQIVGVLGAISILLEVFLKVIFDVSILDGVLLHSKVYFILYIIFLWVIATLIISRSD